MEADKKHTSIVHFVSFRLGKFQLTNIAAHKNEGLGIIKCFKPKISFLYVSNLFAWNDVYSFHAVKWCQSVTAPLYNRFCIILVRIHHVWGARRECFLNLVSKLRHDISYFHAVIRKGNCYYINSNSAGRHKNMINVGNQLIWPWAKGLELATEYKSILLFLITYIFAFPLWNSLKLCDYV